ncbi:unnamed protein product [Microthlaspi erraticum]|uniref:Peptide N-acetyl-beta-D-glucosaminyl asparaginase amidase A N-terminal domain-containing protein n=1 Tax=Microthlaspi erraticum TaxID=1685480 RepID=A0A6D2J3P8_9BRAS|nr:unnamed protein product [Microthlaspi erraticum]
MPEINQNGAVKFFLTLAFLTATTASLPSSPDRFLKSALTSLRSPYKPKKYEELSQPLPSDQLTPSCSHVLLRHSFANTINAPPFTTPYTPPSGCTSPPWSYVVLDLRATSSGDQYDRISGLWLGGVELLRTSTAEPNPTGIFWNVRKDVSRYSSLFMRSDLNVTMMLENIVNDVYTGIYHINVTLHFYESNHIASKPKISSRVGVDGSQRSDQAPADLIIPLCDEGNRGFWFMIESPAETHSKRIQIPSNTRRIVLELYVSFHGNDEFWYSNPPNSYITTNNLATGRGNGAFREVVVKIDGRYVGSEVPFPVIFTGGINPLFWEPVVAIGAFNLPSYDMDLTPFLGLLLDGKSHEFALGVNDGISYWLVDANLHLWLNHESSNVEAGSGRCDSPSRHMVRRAKFEEELDGSFRVEAEVHSEFDGWVKSSEGNLTTVVKSMFKVGNLVKFEQNGSYKRVEQSVKTKRVVEVTSESGEPVKRVVQQRAYPLTVITSTLGELSANDKDMYLLVTNVSHALEEMYSSGEALTELYNRQDSEGWMQVEDHNVLAGEATTRQSFSYVDEFSCYSRNIVAANGEITLNSSSDTCASSSSS